MTDSVLVVNAGSSSVKLAVVDPATGERRVTALAERLDSSEAVLHLRRGSDEHTSTGALSAEEALTRLLDGLTGPERDGLTGVGHRVVHGGSRFSDAVVVDDAVLGELCRLVPLAPLHMPANVRGLELARDALPDLPHVAVFDTAFHQTMPPVAYRYAVPEAWYTDHHVRRYGFHGTSHRFVSARAAELLGRPLTEVEARDAAPRQRLQRGRGRRGALGRHHHGSDSPRGARDGHPQRGRRPRRDRLRREAGGRGGHRGPRGAVVTQRGCSACPG